MLYDTHDFLLISAHGSASILHEYLCKSTSYQCGMYKSVEQTCPSQTIYQIEHKPKHIKKKYKTTIFMIVRASHLYRWYIKNPHIPPSKIFVLRQ